MTDGTTREFTSGRGDLDSEVAYERAADEPPSIAVAVALARHRGEAVTAMSTRLYDHVDPDALDTLFDDGHGGGKRSPGQVQFGVDGSTVTVGPDLVKIERRAAHPPD